MHPSTIVKKYPSRWPFLAFYVLLHRAINKPGSLDLRLSQVSSGHWSSSMLITLFTIQLIALSLFSIPSFFRNLTVGVRHLLFKYVTKAHLCTHTGAERTWQEERANSTLPQLLTGPSQGPSALQNLISTNSEGTRDIGTQIKDSEEGTSCPGPSWLSQESHCLKVHLWKMSKWDNAGGARFRPREVTVCGAGTHYGVQGNFGIAQDLLRDI